MKRWIASFLTLLLLTAAMAGCETVQPAPASTDAGSSSASASSPATQPEAPDYSETGTLRLYYGIGRTGDQFSSPLDLPGDEANMVFDVLMKLDASGETPVPRLAEKYTLSEDGLVYVFTLREGVRWHDGQPVTPEDVEFTLNAYLKSTTGVGKAVLKLIEGGEAVMAGEAPALTGVSISGNDVTLKLTSPSDIFMNTVANTFILPKHLLEQVDPANVGTDPVFWKSPVGCGPYRMGETHFPDYFTLVRNDDYYGKPAGIKNVLFTSFVEGGTDALIAALIAGEIDRCEHSTLADMKTAQTITASNPDIQYRVVPSSYQRFLAFNTAGPTEGEANPDMQNPKVRQAFNLIVDKAAVAAFYGELASPMSTHISPSSTYYNSDIAAWKRDVDTAVQMLEDAGYDFSRKLKLACGYTDQVTQNIMALLVQNFAEAGITAESEVYSTDVVNMIYNVRNFDLYYFGSSGTPSYSTGPYTFYTTTSSANYNKLHSKSDLNLLSVMFDPLMTEAQGNISAGRRKEIADELQVEGGRLMLTIPLYSKQNLSYWNSARFLPSDRIPVNGDFPSDRCFEDWKLLTP